jgi:porphobilinogen synthase
MTDQESQQNQSGVFPTVRMRRLRHNPAVRRATQDVRVYPENLILPLFVRPGQGLHNPIRSMPGHFQVSPDVLVEQALEAHGMGLGGVLLFGIPETKDPIGSDALSDEGILAQAVREVKRAAPGLLVITDLCFCEYTDHGHCGPLVEKNGTHDVDNDATLELLGRQALVHARAGADLIAPSGMMDGMIRAIRTALDGDGFTETPIMSYAAKYASAFYGPFRDAAESAPQMGDRKGYQMDPASSPEQALREVELDVEEGADIVMVKPALPYLDIIRIVHDAFPALPLAAYNVSGEFSMVKAAAANGWVDERNVALETLTAIRRAGAQMIITYWAREFCEWS